MVNKRNIMDLKYWERDSFHYWGPTYSNMKRCSFRCKLSKQHTGSEKGSELSQRVSLIPLQQGAVIREFISFQGGSLHGKVHKVERKDKYVIKDHRVIIKKTSH